MRKNPIGILDFFLVAGWLWILPALIIILIFLIWFLFLWDWIRIQFKLFLSFFFFLSLSFLKDLFEMAVKRWGHLYRQVEGKWIRLTSGWYPVDIRSEIGREFCCVLQLMRCKAFLISSVIRFQHRIQFKSINFSLHFFPFFFSFYSKILQKCNVFNWLRRNAAPNGNISAWNPFHVVLQFNRFQTVSELNVSSDSM